MDDSLTHFLETSTQPISYHIQVNICHDISLALSFLHSNNIIHRDLSSNNVLLIGNVRAKVTDFGMARLDDINPQAAGFTRTVCPGTDVYMPPEAVQNKPIYTEKIDCFSFGVIIVQILTGQFPKPGDRLQEIELNHPGLPRGRVCVCVPEIDRRQNHIAQVPPSNSLLPIALDCLKDEDSKRPSAHRVCERVADLKGMPKYIDSIRIIQGKDELIRLQAIHLEERDFMISLKEDEIQQLRQQLQQEKDRANRRLDEKNREQRFNQQLQQESDLTLRQSGTQEQEKEKQFAHANQQLKASEQKDQQKAKASSRRKELTSFKLRWKEGKRAPCEMSRWFDAVVDGNTVYVMDRGTVNIYSYNATNDSWSLLPDCVHEYGSLTVINGRLTTVGGYVSPSHSNNLFSLTGPGIGKSGRWTKIFPPMPTKRINATSLFTGTTLIVVGGEAEEDRILSTVEVMDTENRQWSTAADLPQQIFYASATVCGDQIYMLGGLNKDRDYTKSVYACSVSSLLQSCSPSSRDIKLKRTSLAGKVKVWRRLADLPITQSTCDSFQGRLLAIGGMTDSRKSTTAVYVYNSTTSSWEIVSHMTTGRYDCFTAVLPDNRLMVVGGETERYQLTDMVEFADIICI